MRKIEELKDLEDLPLDHRCLMTIIHRGYSVAEVVMAARCGQLTKLSGIGVTLAERILKAVDEAGLIMHESTISWGTRRLLAEVLNYPLGTIEEYEARAEFTEQQHDELFELLMMTLTQQELYVLESRFEFTGKQPMALKQIGDELNVSTEWIRTLEAKALRKLRYILRRKRLMEIFPEVSEFGDKILKRPEEFDESIGELSIINMQHLSIRAYRCLMHARINTVGQLMQLTYDEVMKINGITERSANNIREALLEYGCDLKAESDS